MNDTDYLVVSGLLNWEDIVIVNDWVKENCPTADSIGGGWVFTSLEDLALFKLRFNPNWIAGND